MRNTPRKGEVRCIVFKDGDSWYGVALEFNIVESADDPVLAMVGLQEAIKEYVKASQKLRGSHDFSALNQKPDPEYEAIWHNLTLQKPKPSPFDVHYFGVQLLEKECRGV